MCVQIMRMDSDGNVARSESFTDLADVLAGVRDSRPINRSSLGGFVRSASESVDLAHLASSGGKPFGIGECPNLLLPLFNLVCLILKLTWSSDCCTSMCTFSILFSGYVNRYQCGSAVISSFGNLSPWKVDYEPFRRKKFSVVHCSKILLA